MQAGSWRGRPFFQWDTTGAAGGYDCKRQGALREGPLSWFYQRRSVVGDAVALARGTADRALAVAGGARFQHPFARADAVIPAAGFVMLLLPGAAAAGTGLLPAAVAESTEAVDLCLKVQIVFPMRYGNGNQERRTDSADAR